MTNESDRPVLWLVDDNNESDARRDRIETNAVQAGFCVKPAYTCEDHQKVPDDAIGILGHGKNLQCAFVRSSKLRVVHYSGGVVTAPPGAGFDHEYYARDAFPLGKSGRIPSVDELSELRKWLMREGPQPAWVKPFKVTIGVGLPALDILFVGFLAILDREGLAGGLMTDSDEIAAPDGQLGAAEGAGQPGRIKEWFEPAMKLIERAIAQEQDAYWEAIRKESKDPTVQRNVESLRQAYLRLKEAPETVQSEELSQWSELFREAHRAFQELWKGGYL